MSKGTKASLLFYLPLAVVLSFINNTVKSENISGSILFGLIGAASVLFVPFLLKNLRNKNKRN
jgi:pilus assembly protein TadC